MSIKEFADPLKGQPVRKKGGVALSRGREKNFCKSSSPSPCTPSLFSKIFKK